MSTHGIVTTALARGQCVLCTDHKADLVIVTLPILLLLINDDDDDYDAIIITIITTAFIVLSS